MNKTFKILLVTFLFVFLIFTGKCLAVNIDMNLASNLADNNSNIVDDNEIDNSTTNNSVASNTEHNCKRTKSRYRKYTYKQ